MLLLGRCRCFDHRLVIYAALFNDSMANNRRQGFRLVRAITLRPVWGGVLLNLYVPMLDAYNGALASGLCGCVLL
jgi:hypothetical protein